MLFEPPRICQPRGVCSAIARVVVAGRFNSIRGFRSRDSADRTRYGLHYEGDPRDGSPLLV